MNTTDTPSKKKAKEAHPMARRLVSSAEACQAKGQHRKPCADCPWGRNALPGWLGGLTAQEWIAAAHGEAQIECHTALGAQCAGAAIYRANVVKTPRDPATLRLTADTERVFASADEFLAHHGTLARQARPLAADRPSPEAAKRLAEATALAELKPRVRRHSLFGDDHHAAIDAQIAVLREDLSEDAIYARYGDPLDEMSTAKTNVVDAAREARDWLDGVYDLSPTQGWQELLD